MLDEHLLVIVEVLPLSPTIIAIEAEDGFESIALTLDCTHVFE